MGQEPIETANALVADDKDLLATAIEPVSAVAARDVPGGASPRRVREHAQRVRRRAAAARRWNAARRVHIAEAEAQLTAAAKEIAGAG